MKDNSKTLVTVISSFYFIIALLEILTYFIFDQVFPFSAISIPVVEVHISNIAGRESFRHESLLSPVCAGCIFGFGLKGYELAIRFFTEK